MARRPRLAFSKLAPEWPPPEVRVYPLDAEAIAAGLAAAGRLAA
jgi:hypothetical protein